MIATDIIREIMKLKEIKHTVLANRINVKSNTLSERLTQKNISVIKMNEMLRAMDYKLVAVPREARLPDGGYEVE